MRTCQNGSIFQVKLVFCYSVLIIKFSLLHPPLIYRTAGLLVTPLQHTHLRSPENLAVCHTLQLVDILTCVIKFYGLYKYSVAVANAVMDEVSSLWFHELITGLRVFLWVLTVNINEQQIPCLLYMEKWRSSHQSQPLLAAISQRLCCSSHNMAFRGGSGCRPGERGMGAVRRITPHVDHI